MARLSGKTAIITGASSGIGMEAARLFAKEGARMILGARRQKILDELVDEITGGGGSARAMAGDVNDEMYARELVSAAIAQPEEIARAALFLASDESSFVTGTVLYADGGVSTYKG